MAGWDADMGGWLADGNFFYHLVVRKMQFSSLFPLGPEGAKSILNQIYERI